LLYNSDTLQASKAPLKKRSKKQRKLKNIFVAHTHTDRCNVLAKQRNCIDKFRC